MSFDWSDYLALAKELQKQAANSPNQEAQLRSAISRAYYAAFCKARDHLIGEGHSIPSSVNVHSYVRKQYSGSSEQARRQISAHLNRLRTDRNRADYDVSFNGLKNSTRAAIKMAESVISILRTL